MDMTSAADKRRIVLLGKTGDGKSSSANTILGEQAFTVGHGPISQTTECERRDKNIYGKNLAIVDPPGFFNTDRPEEELRLEVARCITKSSPGVHAFLIVLQVGRYTWREEEVLQKITKLFGEEAFKYAVVLFTHGDLLPVDQTIHSFVGKNDKFRTLVQKCGCRCFVMDNTHWNKEHEYRSNKVQMEKLLNTIEEMIAQNGGKCYTNEMLQAVEEAIQREEVVTSQQSGERFTGAEIRQRAEEVVAWKIKAAGLATGALGALLSSIPVLVGATAKLLPCLLKAAKAVGKTGTGAVGTTAKAVGTAEAAKAVAKTGTEAVGTTEAAKTGTEAVGTTEAAKAANAEGTTAKSVGKTGTEAVETAAETVVIRGAGAVETTAKAVGITGAGITGAGVTVAVAGGMSIAMQCAVVAGVAVVATGAIVGANEGLKAARNATTPGEAAEMALEAVTEGAKNILGLNTKEAKK